MGAGSPGVLRGHDEAWAHLRARDDWDVALLQETREPPRWVIAEGGAWVWRPKYADQQRARPLWGCAVVTRDLALAPVEPDARFPWLRARGGSTAIARAAEAPVWLASVHLHARRVPDEVVARCTVDGIEITTPDGSVWETNVIPYELHRLFGEETFLWGGDFNADPRMDEIRGFTGGNRRCFEVYREAGSHDTRERFHDDYQRTYFHPRRRAYQLDHVFADPATADRVTSWRVDPDPSTGDAPLSDHAPVLVTLG